MDNIRVVYNVYEEWSDGQIDHIDTFDSEKEAVDMVEQLQVGLPSYRMVYYVTETEGDI